MVMAVLEMAVPVLTLLVVKVAVVKVVAEKVLTIQKVVTHTPVVVAVEPVASTLLEMVLME